VTGLTVLSLPTLDVDFNIDFLDKSFSSAVSCIIKLLSIILFISVKLLINLLVGADLDLLFSFLISVVSCFSEGRKNSILNIITRLYYSIDKKNQSYLVFPLSLQIR
jgi:hypothetical protein